jgi:hypothetical protein
MDHMYGLCLEHAKAGLCKLHPVVTRSLNAPSINPWTYKVGLYKLNPVDP